jgi:hypothetical protein
MPGFGNFWPNSQDPSAKKPVCPPDGDGAGCPLRPLFRERQILDASRRERGSARIRRCSGQYEVA